MCVISFYRSESFIRGSTLHMSTHSFEKNWNSSSSSSALEITKNQQQQQKQATKQTKDSTNKITIMRVNSCSIILLFIAGAVSSISVQEAKNKRQRNNSLRTSQSRVLEADPASINCSENGGSEENAFTVEGDQYAVCTFKDGSACEEWALFRGKCNKGETLAFISDCEKNHHDGVYKGHRIDTTRYDPDGGAIQGFYYTFQYADGSVCFEYDYYQGKC